MMIRADNYRIERRNERGEQSDNLWVCACAHPEHFVIENVEVYEHWVIKRL